MLLLTHLTPDIHIQHSLMLSFVHNMKDGSNVAYLIDACMLNNKYLTN